VSSIFDSARVPSAGEFDDGPEASKTASRSGGGYEVTAPPACVEHVSSTKPGARTKQIVARRSSGDLSADRRGVLSVVVPGQVKEGRVQFAWCGERTSVTAGRRQSCQWRQLMERIVAFQQSGASDCSFGNS